MENRNTIPLFDLFDDVHPALRDSRRLFVAENGSDTPVFEFSNYARTLLNTYLDWAPAQLRGLFSLVESVLASGSEFEQAAVATGFLELLIHKLDESPAAKAALVPLFGPKARQFCREYNEYGGIHWPELDEPT